jgi:hypothetical protein
MYPDSNIWIIGHSLGGALASLLGVTFGAPVVAFESPGEKIASKRLHLPSPVGVNGRMINQTLMPRLAINAAHHTCLQYCRSYSNGYLHGLHFCMWCCRLRYGGKVRPHVSAHTSPAYQTRLVLTYAQVPSWPLNHLRYSLGGRLDRPDRKPWYRDHHREPAEQHMEVGRRTRARSARAESRR